MKRLLRGAIRGIALFIGGFSALNIVVSRLGTARGEDIWWINFSGLPSFVSTIISIVSAVLLIIFALKPAMSEVRRWATVVFSLICVLFALINTIGYYGYLARGVFTTKVPLPFSLLVVVTFILITVAVWRMHDTDARWYENMTMVVIALAGILLFPMTQFYTFGNTNYASKADVAVVFGARAFPDGTLSSSLKDRVDTSIQLYKDGLVPKLIFTGGIDADGVNEVEMMKKYAVAAGVKAGDILLDDGGNDTDLSVRNTTPLLKEIGAKKVLAVSQFYHLPRIKMAYRAARTNVLTVPAIEPRPIRGTPAFVVRETLAFWAYWLRDGARDLNISAADRAIDAAEIKYH
jgi:vancomycin permeability regulator SanA